MKPAVITDSEEGNPNEPSELDYPPVNLEVRWLGRLGFAEALAMQEEIVAAKKADRSLPDEILLLEHDPVYTIGRTPDQSSLRGVDHLSHPLFPINRGGQATYHGPGQLIGYPIIDLHRYGQDLHRYLRWLEQLLIELLKGSGITADRREGLTGVWVADRQPGSGRQADSGRQAGRRSPALARGQTRCGEENSDRKIASIGVGVRHWITMHGFALNVAGDLAPFSQIVPCGISNVIMTSMEKETGRTFSLVDVARDFEKLVRQRIGDLR